MTVKPPSRPRRFFMKGLAVLLPSILTLWILWYAFVFVFDNVAAPINRWIRTGVLAAVPHVIKEPYRPEWYRVTPEQERAYRRDNPNAALADESMQDDIRRKNLTSYWEARWHLQAVGLLVAIVGIYLAGGLVGGFVGRRIYGRVERIIARIPVFRQIYPHVKQVVDMVLGDSPMAFNRVVMIQFPRPGTWVIAFVTGSSMRAINDGIGRPCLTVFVPNTPTPFTGFTLTVPVEDVIDVPISVDEAIRYLITGGVLVPDGQAGAAPTLAGDGHGAPVSPPPGP